MLLYDYMKDKLQELYSAADRTVTIDMDHFMMLYRQTCDMMHIGNIVRSERSTMDAIAEAMQGTSRNIM